LNYADNLI
jgi:serine/threonine-protein kinase TTK/MPS1